MPPYYRRHAALPRPLGAPAPSRAPNPLGSFRFVAYARSRQAAPVSRFRRLAPLHMLAVAAWCLSVAVRRARSCLRLAAHARRRRVAPSRCGMEGMSRPASPHKQVAAAWCPLAAASRDRFLSSCFAAQASRCRIAHAGRYMPRRSLPRPLDAIMQRLFAAVRYGTCCRRIVPNRCCLSAR